MVASGQVPRSVYRRLGQQEFDLVKNLLVAASLAALLAAEAVPALAQSATTSQPGWAAVADNGAAGSVQAPNDSLAQPAISSGVHVGDGSRPDYLRHKQELRDLPGYSVSGNG